MFKTIMGYSIPKGTDPEEFWKYHTEVHAADAMSAGGTAMKKYVINRVTSVTDGQTNLFGLVEIWWESEEAWRQAQQRFASTKAASGTTQREDFFSHAKMEFRVIVDEVVKK